MGRRTTCHTAFRMVAGSALLLVLTARARAEDCDGNGVEDSVDLASTAVALAIADRHDVGQTPRNVIARDVSGDGAIDVLTPNRHSNSIAILVNGGAGELASPVFVEASNPAWMAVADFDRDGALDLAAVSTLASRIELFRGGSEAGAFSRTAVELGRGGWDFVEAGDIDGDGAADLALVNRFERLVGVLFHTGQEAMSFEEPIEIAIAAGGQPRALALGDFDADGDVDIAVATEAAGASEPSEPGRLVMIPYGGDRSFDAPAAVDAPSVSPRWVRAVDIDRDGDDDLAWLDIGAPEGGDSALVISENRGRDGPAHRVVAEGDIELFAIGGFDDDDVPDIAVFASDGRVSILREGGRLAQPPHLALPLDNIARSAIAADLDGDGRDELVTANYTDDQGRNEVAVLEAEVGPAYRDTNDNGILDTCEWTPIVFGIEGPAALSAASGAIVRAEYVCTLLPDTSRPFDLFGGPPRPLSNGPMSWSLGVAATGVRIVEASFDGTAGEEQPMGFVAAGFKLVRVVEGDDPHGVVSVVVLSAVHPVTLPLAEASPVLRLTVEAELPSPGVERAGALFHRDGLPSGPERGALTVPNGATIEGQFISAVPAWKAIRIARRRDLNVGAGRPFATVQAAIDAASAGDHVVVGPGEHVLDAPIDFRGKPIIVRSLSGARSTVLRMSETPADPTRASVVVFENGESAESVLEGFTLTGGRGTVLDPRYSGWVLFESPVGGGILCRDASPIVRDCIITRNRSMEEVFTGHSPNTNGGAAVTCLGDSRALFERCIIANNRGGQVGGVLSMDTSITLRHSTITSNSGYNAAVFLLGDRGRPTVTGCLIAGNGPDAVDRAGSGSGIEVRGVAATISYCTIADNRGDDLVILTNSRSDVVNTIAWSSSGGRSTTGAAPPRTSLIDVDPRFVRPGVYAFDRTIGEFPDFVVEPGDYRLQTGSPALEAGTIAGVLDTDIDGRPRRCGGARPFPRPDIGAYESGCNEPFRRGDANGDGRVDLSDGIRILSYLFLGASEPPCLDAADTDDSGTLDLSDGVGVNVFLFLGGAPLVAPGPFACGADPTFDGLGCGRYTVCR